MNQETISKAFEELKKEQKRKFDQSVDLIINLKNLSIKQNPIDFFTALPKDKGLKLKICAFVDENSSAAAKEHVDKVITDQEFGKYKGKEAKKLSSEFDLFIAQANLMPKIATTFGKFLGTKGKMPSPKLGNIVPPGANLAPIVAKLQKTVRMTAKKATNLQCMIGKESMSAEDISANVLAVYNNTLKQVPNEKNNIKSVQLKLTMTKSVRIDGK